MTLITFKETCENQNDLEFDEKHHEFHVNAGQVVPLLEQNRVTIDVKILIFNEHIVSLRIF